MVLASKPVEHGMDGYRAKCRCEVCRAAKRNYATARSYAPENLTVAEAVVALEMIEEAVAGIAALFDVSDDEIYRMIRSRNTILASPLDELPEREIVKEEKYGMVDDPKVEDIIHPPTPLIAARPVEPLRIVRDDPERSYPYIGGMIGQPRKFTAEEPLHCYDCSNACSAGWCREMDNGFNVPHTFLAYCPPCSVGWEETLSDDTPLSLLKRGDRKKGYQRNNALAMAPKRQKTANATRNNP